MQTLQLDMAALLITTLKAARKGSLTPRDAAKTAQLALKLLGNASMNISMEKCHKASTHLNAELSTLVEDEDSFKDVAPLLFGRGFDQKSKEHMAAIKSLNKTVIPASQSFQRSHPHSPREVACPGAGGQRISAGQKQLNNAHTTKFNKTFKQYGTNKLQSKTPTTEIVINTKVSNPTIYRVQRIQ